MKIWIVATVAVAIAVGCLTGHYTTGVSLGLRVVGGICASIMVIGGVLISLFIIGVISYFRHPWDIGRNC